MYRLRNTIWSNEFLFSHTPITIDNIHHPQLLYIYIHSYSTPIYRNLTYIRSSEERRRPAIQTIRIWNVRVYIIEYVSRSRH